MATTKRARESHEGDDSNEKGLLQLHNPHIKDLVDDHLYHFGISHHEPLQKRFGDVKIVCMGGSIERMQALAYKVSEVLDFPPAFGQNFVDICKTDRYCMYKVGPVLCVNHGMGVPSMSIMLHEIAKLVHYAKCKDVVLLRTGTSGGLGVTPGTVIIASQAVSGLLEPFHKVAILGKEVQRETTFDNSLAADLLACSPPGVLAKIGKTMCCHDFYEGQARLDGAICDYTLEDKMAFLKRAREAGVDNIEMEGLALASFCNALHIRGGMMCCTLLDRLLGDQLEKDHAKLDSYQNGPQAILFNYIKKFVLHQNTHAL